MVAKKTVFGFALFGIIVLAGIIFLAFFLGAPGKPSAFFSYRNSLICPSADTTVEVQIQNLV